MRVALAQRRLQLPELLEESTMLEIVPISKPGTAGFSYALAINDAVETTVRKQAAAQGLLAGTPMPIEPGSQFWSFVDIAKRRRDRG